MTHTLLAAAVGRLEGLTLCLFLFVTLVAFWRICRKAGFPGWYSLAVFIPILNLALILFLAFAEWPIERALRGDSPRLGDGE